MLHAIDILQNNIKASFSGEGGHVTCKGLFSRDTFLCFIGVEFSHFWSVYTCQMDGYGIVKNSNVGFKVMDQ